MKKNLKRFSALILLLIFGFVNVDAAETNFLINKNDIENDTYIIGDYMFNHKDKSDNGYVGDDEYSGVLYTEYLMLGANSIDVENDNKNSMKVYYKNLRGVWVNPLTDEEINENDVPSEFPIMYINNKFYITLQPPIVPSANGEDGEFAFNFDSYGDGKEWYNADIVRETGLFYSNLDEYFGNSFNVVNVNVYVNRNGDSPLEYVNYFQLDFTKESEIQVSFQIKLPNAVIESPKSQVIRYTPKLPAPNLKIVSNVYDSISTVVGQDEGTVYNPTPILNYASFIPAGSGITASDDVETDTEINYGIYAYNDNTPLLIYVLGIENENYYKIDSDVNSIGYDLFDYDTNKRITKKNQVGEQVNDVFFEGLISAPVEVGKTRKIYAKPYVLDANGGKIYGNASNVVTIGGSDEKIKPLVPCAHRSNMGIGDLNMLVINETHFDATTNSVVYNVSTGFNYVFDSKVAEIINNEINGIYSINPSEILSSFPVEMVEVTNVDWDAENARHTYNLTNNVMLSDIGNFNVNIPLNQKKSYALRTYIIKKDGTKIYSDYSFPATFNLESE